MSTEQERLQATDHRSSAYERPNQKWVCGWTAEGRPCPLGPDGKGHCPAHQESECTPRRDGDRFLCTRPVVFGGPCEHGPMPDGSCCRPAPRHPPCQPVTSLRARRGRLVAAVVALVLGLAALGFGTSGRLWLINPGPLSAAHEPIGEFKTDGDQCKACHSAADHGMRQWVGMALTPVHGIGDSGKCLDCHFKGNTSAFALRPHSLDPAQLHKGKAGEHPTAGLMLASLEGGPMQGGDGQLACGSCHHEHRGVHANLAAMSNTECQACHQSTFNDFAGNHPDFGPIVRERSGINFDHRTHAHDHFGREQAFVCTSCHRRDPNARSMTTLGFDASCGGCHKAGKEDHHLAKIRDDRFTAFQLPDLAFSADPPAGWPKGNAKGTEIPPMTMLLMAGDPAVLPALASLVDDGGDATDWPSGDDDPSLKRALAKGLRALQDDVAVDEASWLKARLAEAAAKDVNSDAVRNLYADTRDTADELRGELAGVLGTVADSPAVDDLAIGMAGAEAPRSAGLAALVARHCPELGDKQRQSAVTTLADGKVAAACTAVPPKALDGALDSVEALQEVIADGLAIDVDSAIVRELAAASLEARRRLEYRIARAVQRPMDDPSVVALARQLKGAGLALGEWRHQLAAASPVPAAEPAADAAGWQIDRAAASVVYQSVGHADPLLHAWLDVAMRSGPVTGATQPVLADVRRRVAGSECLSCHVVDRQGASSIVNWRNAGRSAKAIGFEKFNHAPHVTLFGDGGCDKCHSIASDKKDGESAHGFAVIDKKVCAECHRPRQANSDCLTCHRYHLASP